MASFPNGMLHDQRLRSPHNGPLPIPNEAPRPSYVPWYTIQSHPYPTTLGGISSTDGPANADPPFATAPLPLNTVDPTSLLPYTSLPFMAENNATLPAGQYYHMQQTRSAQGPTSSPNRLFAHPAYPEHSYAPQFSGLPMSVNGLSNNRDFVPNPPDPHPLLGPRQNDLYSPYYHHPTPFFNVHDGSILHEYSNLSNQIAEHNANSFVFIPMYPAGVPTSPPSPAATTSASSGRSTPVLGPQFVETSFPLESEDHARLREQLNAVMNSEWKLRDQMEPDKDCLLQFIPKDEATKAHVCLFWNDSGPCEKVIKRPQHAKTHVRKHISHRPYVCAPNCPLLGSDCPKRYRCSNVLAQHRKHDIQCDQCKMPMRPSNLQRHKETACKGSP